MKAQPVRIRRRREKGQRLTSPNGLPVIYVGRPTKWGNPYRIIHRDGPLIVDDTPAIYNYEVSKLLGVPEPLSWRDAQRGIVGLFRKKYRNRSFEELRGKNLACWCSLSDSTGKPFPCHADVILELANGFSCKEAA
jgi:hypothetical protein